MLSLCLTIVSLLHIAQAAARPRRQLLSITLCQSFPSPTASGVEDGRIRLRGLLDNKIIVHCVRCVASVLFPLPPDPNCHDECHHEQREEEQPDMNADPTNGRRQRQSHPVAGLSPVPQLQVTLQAGTWPKSVQPVHPRAGRMQPSPLSTGPGSAQDSKCQQRWLFRTPGNHLGSRRTCCQHGSGIAAAQPARLV